MTNNTQQLPADVLDRIRLEAEEFANRHINGRTQPEIYQIVYQASETAATEYATKWFYTFEENGRLATRIADYVEKEKEYATKLLQVEQEIAQLKKWKMEAAELLTPINAYVHKHIEKSLGQSCVKLVLDRCKQYEQALTLLQKFISRHEAGLLPDRFIYNEIKTFLNGTK